MPTVQEQVEKLGGAVQDVGKAHGELAEQLRAEIEARGDLGDWPAIKGKLDEVDGLKANLTEVQDLLKALDQQVKITGGDGADAGPLVRIDPGYHNPAQKRFMPNATAAKALAHFVRAVITGSEKSKEYLEDQGIELKKVQDVERAGSIHDDELGAYALPPEFGGVIAGALAAYGTFAQYADLESMAAPKKTFAKDGTDVQVYALEEGETIPEVDAEYSQVTLETKLFGAFTRWSTDFEEFGLTGVGEGWAERFARAIAKKMEQCGWLGDGTSTYNNMIGVFNNADVTLQSLASGKTAFGDMDYDDLVDLMAAVPDEVYAEGNSRFFMSNNMLWLLAKLKDGEGRPLLASPTEGISRSILGEPIANSAVFPRLTDSAAGTKFMAFGDLRRAYKLGVRTQMSIAFSPHAYFRQAQNSLRVLTRFGVKSAFASGLAVLKTADS